MKDYPINDLRAYRDNITKKWNDIINTPVHQVYEISDEEEEAFRTSFKLLFSKVGEIPGSFYRRVLFGAVKYALLYHILFKKPDIKFDAKDIGWAARISVLHLNDVKWLLEEHGLSDLEHIIRRVEVLKEKCEKQGEKLTTRYISNIISKTALRRF